MINAFTRELEYPNMSFLAPFTSKPKVEKHLAMAITTH
jgi:hypothetical protein